MSKVSNNKKLFIKRFNTNIFNFRKIITNSLIDENIIPKKNKNLPLGLDKNNQLKNLHFYLNSNKIEIAYRRIYSEFRSQKFQKLYDNFCKYLIKTNNLNKNIRYQSIPSVRIHMPGMASVNFHSDFLYGHGKNIINFWVPLTAVEKTNSLHIVSQKDSTKLIKYFIKAKSSIVEMNNLSKKKSVPLKINFGEYFVFNSKILHGTLVNKTRETRVSFDFRMVKETDEIGVKDKSFFIKIGERNLKITNKKNRVACYFSKPINALHLPSQKYQQTICNQYCTDKNLRPIIFETELTGFDYYPVLKNLIDGNWKNHFDHLVVFSVNNFPKNKKKYNDILKRIKKNKVKLHFVLESRII